MTELLKQAEALGWYESDVCDDWIVLSPIKEKDNLFIKTTIYIEWGALAPQDYEIEEIVGFDVRNTTKPIPEDILEVIKKMLALYEKEVR